MPTYKYTGDEPRTPAPPLQGDLEPGETVEASEPVLHPDLEPADEETKAATDLLRAEREAAAAVEASAEEEQPAPTPAVTEAPRRRSARQSQE